MSFIRILLVISLFICLTGCQDKTGPESIPPTEVELQPNTDSYPYPYPVISIPTGYISDDSYPGPLVTMEPTPTIPEKLIVPTPGEDTGVVIGQLLTKADNKPFVHVLYLANTISAQQEGFPPMISLSEDTAPVGIQDVGGNFYFAEVPPGVYALVLWGPLSGIVITEPESETYMTFEVAPGKVLDLGTIFIP